MSLWKENFYVKISRVSNEEHLHLLERNQTLERIFLYFYKQVVREVQLFQFR